MGSESLKHNLYTMMGTEFKVVAFNVEFEPPSVDVTYKVPKRLKENVAQKNPLTAEQLDEKLRLAEERRKAYEAAKIHRMKQRQAECKRVDRAMASLLKQDDRHLRSHRRVRTAFGFTSHSQNFSKKSSGGVAFVIDFNKLTPASDEPARVPQVLRPYSAIPSNNVYAEENLIVEDMDESPRQSPVGSPDRPKPVAFMVNFTDDHMTKGEAAAKVPERIRQRRTSGPTTAEQLQAKLKQAEERKKAYEAAKIERIKQKEEEMLRVSQACSVLFRHERRHVGYPGSENLRPMTRREAAMAVQEAVRGFDRMNAQFETDINNAMEFYRDLRAYEQKCNPRKEDNNDED